MESKGSTNITMALQEFIDDVGIPETLVCDFASEQTGKSTDVMKIVRGANIKLRIAKVVIVLNCIFFRFFKIQLDWLLCLQL
mgnify:CR=1 FL=1